MAKKIALKEVFSGKVVYKTPEEIEKWWKDLEKFVYRGKKRDNR